MSKHIELAKKLKALADHGIGGEKVNAEIHLDKLLKKHKLKMDDIEVVNRIKTHFSYSDSLHKRFIVQVIQSVVGEREVSEWIDKRYKKVYCLLTIWEYLEITEKVDFYWAHFQNELNLFYSAYIQTNNLYIKDSVPDNVESMTKKEKEKWKRMWDMAETIKQASILKRIE